MDIENEGYKSEEERIAAESFGKEAEGSQEMTNERKTELHEMAMSLGLSSEQLKELGFEQEAKYKAVDERAGAFLDQQLFSFTKGLASSEARSKSFVEFSLPSGEGSVGTYELQKAFKERTNRLGPDGKSGPMKIFGDNKLKLSSSSGDERSLGGGAYTGTGATWRLELAPYESEEDGAVQRES